MSKLAFLLGVSIALNSVGVNGISFGFVISSIYIIKQLSNFVGLSNLTQFFGKFIFLPFVFIIIVLFNNLIYTGISDAPLYVKTYFLDYILYLCVLNHSIHNKDAVHDLMHGLIYGASIMSVFYVLGIGVEVKTMLDGDRFSVLEMNSNVLGLIESITFIVTLNDFILNKEISNKKRMFYGILMLLQLELILATASRTAFLIISISFIFSILLTNISRNKKILLIFFGLIVFACGIIYLISQDSVIMVRMFSSHDEGSMSGRTDIWEELLPEIPNNIILGRGETGYSVIVQKVLGHFVSPHNEIIFMLLVSGVIGTAAMCLFWYKSFKKGYAKYKIDHDPIAVLVFVPILFAILSQQILYEKFGWISCAYMIALSYNYQSKISRYC